MTREEILREATKCVCGQREEDYGKPEDNFGIIADLWSTYTGTIISPVDVCMMMAMLKITRAKNNNDHLDNYIDICGYASCAGEIASEKRELKLPSVIDAKIEKFWDDKG